MDFGDKQVDEGGKIDPYNTQTKLGLESAKLMYEENEQNNLQPQKLDDVLASILKDLEFAAVSLQSTSHLLDQSDTDVKPDLHTQVKAQTEDSNPVILDLDSISFKEDNNEEESSGKGTKANITTCDEQESKLSSSEREANNTETPQRLEEDTTKFVDTTTPDIDSEITPGDSKDESVSEIKPQYWSSSNQPQKTDLKIPLPSTNPYINFVQDFKAKYKGHELTATMLVALATARWRKMGKEERQVYKNIGKGRCEKNKQVEKLKNYIKAFKTSEESLFQDAKI